MFLIQNTQNRDNLALPTKLDELILTSEAENEFIGIERLTDRELEQLHARCARAAALNEKLALGDVQPSTGSGRGARALNPLTPPQRP